MCKFGSEAICDPENPLHKPSEILRKALQLLDSGGTLVNNAPDDSIMCGAVPGNQAPDLMLPRGAKSTNSSQCAGCRPWLAPDDTQSGPLTHLESSFSFSIQMSEALIVHLPPDSWATGKSPVPALSGKEPIIEGAGGLSSPGIN